MEIFPGNNRETAGGCVSSGRFLLRAFWSGWKKWGKKARRLCRRSASCLEGAKCQWDSALILFHHDVQDGVVGGGHPWIAHPAHIADGLFWGSGTDAVGGADHHAAHR